MSFSLILEEFKGLSILYLNFGNVVAFLTGAHWSTKCGLKSSDFILKWNTSLPSLPHGWHFSFIQKSTYDGPIYFWSCIGGYLKKMKSIYKWKDIYCCLFICVFILKCFVSIKDSNSFLNILSICMFIIPDFSFIRKGSIEIQSSVYNITMIFFMHCLLNSAIAGNV